MRKRFEILTLLVASVVVCGFILVPAVRARAADSPPTITSVSVNSDASLTVKWTKSADQDSYELLYDTTNTPAPLGTTAPCPNNPSSTCVTPVGAWGLPQDGTPLECYWTYTGQHNSTWTCIGHQDLADDATSASTSPLTVGTTYYVQVLVFPHAFSGAGACDLACEEGYYSNVVSVVDRPTAASTTTKTTSTTTTTSKPVTTTTTEAGSASLSVPPVGNVQAVVTAATKWFTKKVSCDNLQASGVLTPGYRNDLAAAAAGGIKYSATTTHQAQAALAVFDACMKGEQAKIAADTAKATAQKAETLATKDQQLAAAANQAGASNAQALAAQAAAAATRLKKAQQALAAAEAKSKTTSVRCFVVYDAYGHMRSASVCPRPVVGTVGQK